MLASHYYDPVTNTMRAVDGRPMRDVHTSFMILKDGKVIFDGTAHDLGEIQDPYIKEYIS
jgi:phospholipid/cholesterol/gamma-HCH transport system ATP-binding protein